MILGTDLLRDRIARREIVSDPAPARIEGTHIDVTLGAYAWLFTPCDDVLRLRDADPLQWFTLHELAPEFALPPGGFAIMHTEEFIGAPAPDLLPILHTRSTMARWGHTIHLSAGLGDPKYASRWALEVFNWHQVPVVFERGMRVGSLSFYTVAGDAVPYAPGTRYNATQSEWTPEKMLPRRSNW